jgi:hypothetical protein
MSDVHILILIFGEASMWACWSRDLWQNQHLKHTECSSDHVASLSSHFGMKEATQVGIPMNLLN